MKKTIVSLLAVAGFIFSVNAQEPGMMKQQNHQHEKGMMMMKELNLTEAQKEQMKANHESFKKQMMELDKNENITVKEYRDRKEAMHKAQKEKMMSLLTTEQKNKLEQFKKERKAKHEAIAAKKLERMKANLGLTDDQVAKIKESREAIHAQLKAIKDNDKLGRVEKKEQLMALREQVNS